MFERWYIVKFDYIAPTTSTTKTEALGYMQLTDAEHIFRKLEVSYQYDTPVRVKGDNFIKIMKVCLYEVFDFYRDDAIKDVNVGKGRMLFEARGIDIDVI